MWNDIHVNRDKLVENLVVESLVNGGLTWTPKPIALNLKEEDKTLTPDSLSLPVPVDSSQMAAVLEAGKGTTFILYGPPGTGKSQTITNIISNALYQGKRVLFVAEKMAALNVVQELQPETYRLAKMNLAVRGISHDLGNEPASTFLNEKHKDKKMDYIITNPPFNLKKWRAEDELTSDPRWSGYDIPPVSNANYAWILHILNKLNVDTGIAGFLLANGALDDSDTVSIRQKLIENDKVEAIMILPRNMFYTTDTSVTLWIINQNKKGGVWHGRNLRDRTGEVLFVDLRTWRENIYEKKYVRFSDEQIKKVCDIYWNWQTTESETYAEPELYYSAKKEEIEAKGWTLVPSRYIEFVDRGCSIDIDSAVEQADEIVRKINSVQENCLSKLSEILKVIASFKSLEDKYPLVEIGPYLEEVDERNSDLSVTLSQGVANTKVFQTPKQVSANSKSDKIVRTGQFAYNRATTRNGEKISIAC